MPRKFDAMSVLVAVLSLAGCGRSGGDSAGWDSNPDLDGDSFHAGADCDDGDAAVHPGAEEVCDGIDNDCDQTIDVGAVDATTAWYDGDRDGFGRNPPESWCDLPKGYVTEGDDCDDTRADVNPDAPEVCDPKNVDEDCDFTADDEDASAGNLGEFYVDADGDGYGVDDATPIIGCDAPLGYAPLPGDCDDTSPTANPATVEVCGDTADDDCDGSVSCTLYGDVSAGDADVTLRGASDTVHLGGARFAGDVDGNGVGDVVVGAYYDTGMFVFLGPLRSTTSDSAVANIRTWPDGMLYGALAMRDQDVDGYDDMAFLSPDYKSSTGSGGRSFVLLGPISGTLDADAAADATITGGSGDILGAAASAGDVDGDGIVDIVLAAYDVPGPAAYLFLGPVTSGFLGEWAADARLDGVSSISAACAAGDLDGDGVNDVLVTAQSEDKGAGGGWVFRGPVLGDQQFSDADVTISGSTEHLGWRATTSGDLDGDGTEDVAIGEYPYGALTTLYVLSGSTVTSSSEIDVNEADAVIESDPATYGGGAQFGYGIDSGGDVDGDGITDLAVTDYGTTAGGNVWAFLGPLAGTLTASSDAAFVLFPVNPKDGFGVDVALMPDVTGDGFDDLLTPAAMYDWPASAGNGEVYVFATGP